MKETLEEFKVYCEEDIVDILQKGNVEPTQINRIIYRSVSSNQAEFCGIF